MASSAEGGANGPSVEDLRRLETTVSSEVPIRTGSRRGDLPAWLLVALGVVAVATVNVLLPRGYDVSSLYAIVVLASGFTRDRRYVIGTALTTGTIVAVVTIAKVPGAQDDLGPMLFSHITAIGLIAASCMAVLIALNRTARARRLEADLRVAESSRAQTTKMIAAASEIAPIGTWYFDPEQQAVIWGPRAAAIIEVEPDTPIDVGQAIHFLAPHDQERFLGSFLHAFQTRSPFRSEFDAVTASGARKHLLIMGDPVSTDEQGRMMVHGSMQDITRWAEAESAAEEEARRFASFAESLPFAVWGADAQGSINFANSVLHDFWGRGNDPAQPDAWPDLIHPDDVDDSVAGWASAVQTGEAFENEIRMRATDGHYEWFHVSATAERDDDGNVVRWWGATVNVDSAVRLKQHAEDLAAEVATILESTTDGVYAVDHDWRIAYSNSSARAEIGRLSDDLVGEKLWDVFPFTPDPQAMEGLQIAMATGTPHTFTYFSKGLKKWFTVTATPTPRGLSVFHRDVTEVRRLSEQLAQAQRLESVGRLTGGIAHDFNNVLTVVLGGAEAVAEDPQVGHEAREMAELVVESAKRGADLTSRLLAFARKQPLEPHAVDLADCLDTLAPMLKRTVGERVDLAVSPDLDLPAVMLDVGQFENALINLVLNARDSMPDGGKVAIGATETVLDDDYAESHADVRPGRYVLVDVSDSGEGIDPEDVDRLFEPFFTTKAKGKGSGLGLAMVWGFVKQTGGHIAVYSEPGVGTTFKLYLPLSRTDAATRAPHELPPIRPIRPGVILLAEDDDLVRAFASERLRGLGHTVHAAASGPEALALMETLDQVDLLFTDVIMPDGMTGRDLADEVHQRRPEVPVLFTSGYTENVVLHDGRLDEGVLLLSKPYTAQQLTERVSEAMERTSFER
ncbi:PAS domain-containing sensor histidine kinase [Demequina sp. NBRC 110054]|uniref:hybrid sensor histidine kinase/response regulator n=1 Tax=Demequina sp. NBRC 110054 TaxID=1570343 RepID=UPI000A04ECBD|nr:PAS domain-containing sensor histidine kinase [Demequina sp. NBRC 110054]